MEKILKEIRRFAGYYDRILNSIKTEPNEVFTEAILRHLWYVNQMPQASTIYPFLLRLLDDYAEHKVVDEDTLVDCLEIVQSYIVRRVFCNRGRKAFNMIFSPLYRRAFSESEYFDKKAERLRHGITREGYVECIQRSLGARTTDQMFLSNEEFDKEYEKFHLYRNTTFCRYILLRLEEALSGQKSDTFPKEVQLTIEHIFPQRPSPYSAWGKMSHDGLLHTLGNLTLTSLNSEMGNGTFAEKRKCYEKSGLKMNKYLIDLDPRTKWNGEKIRERSAELYRLMKKIWRDIPRRYCKGMVSEEIPMKDIDVDDFLDGENNPVRISYVMCGENMIDGRKYPGRKKWKKHENELPSAWDTPDGEFYNEVLQCLYAGHEGTFDNTTLGETVGLEKTDEEEDGVRFVVPCSIIGDDRFAIQTDYAQMRLNIKAAADETGTLETMRIRFEH